MAFLHTLRKLFLPAVLVCGLLHSAAPAPAAPQAEPGQDPETGISLVKNAAVPLDAQLKDEYGGDVRLGSYFNKGRPVILTLVYYGCPSLCTSVLTNLTTSLKDPKMGLALGQDYDMVTVSFDPADTPAVGRAKKENYLKELGKPDSGHAWHFLTGTEPEVRKIARAVGFGYRWNPVSHEFVHPSAIFLLTSDGTLSRPVQDLVFEPDMLHDSLVNASNGKIGGPLLRLAFTCGLLSYNHATGRNTWLAMGVVRAGAILTMLGLGGTVAVLWWRDPRRRGESAPGGPNQVKPV